jgi:hypothetical protein
VTIAELGVIDVAAHRHGDVDTAVGVGQDGDGEIERQFHRAGTLHALAELQALKNDLVLALQLAVVELVLEVEVHRAGLDSPPGKRGAVRRQRRHRHVAEDYRDVREDLRPERAQRSLDLDEPELVHLSVELTEGTAIASRRSWLKSRSCRHLSMRSRLGSRLGVCQLKL